MRTRFSPARCCCGNTTITVTKCVATGRPIIGIPGYGVKIQRSGTVYFDGVTDANGQVKTTLPTAGVAYTIILTAGDGNPRYGNVTRTFTPTSLPYVGTQAAPPAVGYVCAFGGRDPVAQTLYVTLGDGTYPVTYFISQPIPYRYWIATLATKSDVSPVATRDTPLSPWVCGQTLKLDITVRVELYETGEFVVQVTWPENPAFGPPCPGNYGVGSVIGLARSVPIQTSWSFPLAAAGGMTQTSGNLPCPVGLGFAASE